MKTRTAFAWVLVLSIVWASSAEAQNLLLNGGFDSDIAGWSIGSQEFIVISHSPTDVDTNPASGSLEMNTATTGWASQCVPIAGGSPYSLSGFIAPLSTGGGALDFSLEVAWNDSQGCAGSLVGTLAQLVAPNINDVWHPLSGNFNAPASAVSAQVRLKSVWISGSSLARFDAVYLPEPSGDLMLVAAGLSLFAIRLRRARL